MKRCFVYPGQGAQYVGMGKDIYDRYPGAHRIFDRATQCAGFDVAALLWDGTDEDLKATDRSQVAITVVNLAARAALAERGIVSDAAAGFSLGEYAALVDAGVISEDDCLTLVVERGRIMERVSRSLDGADGSAGMAAVLGIDSETIETALADGGVEGVYPANLNSPVQTVLSGTAAGLAAAEPVLKAAGARRVVVLKVSGPFHSPLMSDARTAFAAVLDRVEFSDPSKPLYSNVTGARVGSGTEIRRLCADQLVMPVRWVDEEAHIAADGYDELLEVGPGEVLGGLWKAYLKSADGVDVPCRPAGTVDTIETIAQ